MRVGGLYERIYFFYQYWMNLDIVDYLIFVKVNFVELSEGELEQCILFYYKGVILIVGGCQFDKVFDLL